MFGGQILEETTGLVFTQAAEIHHLFAGDLAVLLDIPKDYLLLLDPVEAHLADVVGPLAQLTVETGTEGVGSALFDAVGLGQSSFD